MSTGKGALINIDTMALRRLAGRVESTPKRVAAARKRAVVTLSRRLKAEAARQVSELQLNLRPRQISPYIKVIAHSGDALDYVSVNASDTRLPLRAFGAKASKRSGVTVTTWRDRGAQTLPHAWRRGNEILQRVPYRGQAGTYMAPSGLVPRLPITARVGPSLKRALQPVGRFPAAPNRDRVVAHLLEFGQGVLFAEMQRLAGAS